MNLILGFRLEWIEEDLRNLIFGGKKGMMLLILFFEFKESFYVNWIIECFRYIKLYL